jgi:hypothetical protein
VQYPLHSNASPFSASAYNGLSCLLININHLSACPPGVRRVELCCSIRLSTNPASPPLLPTSPVGLAIQLQITKSVFGNVSQVHVWLENVSDNFSQIQVLYFLPKSMFGNFSQVHV